MSRSECLILGPEGAGKTLLMKKLEEYAKRKKGSGGATAAGSHTSGSQNYVSIASQPINHTVPTVGVNLAHLKLTKEVTCSLRESGGQMAPLWHNGYQDCRMVIYVIDSSNQVQVSASTVLLLDVLSSEALREKPVLVFFNKTDSPLGLGLVEYKSVMRLEDIVSHATQRVSVVDGSCWTGEGIGVIMEWLLENCREK